MKCFTIVLLFFAFTVYSHDLHTHHSHDSFTCANEVFEKEEAEKYDTMAVCNAPSTSSCYHKDKM